MCFPIFKGIVIVVERVERDRGGLRLGVVGCAVWLGVVSVGHGRLWGFFVVVGGRWGLVGKVGAEPVIIIFLPGAITINAFQGGVDLPNETVGVVSVARFGGGNAVVFVAERTAFNGGEGVLGGHAGQDNVVSDDRTSLVLLHDS